MRFHTLRIPLLLLTLLSLHACGPGAHADPDPSPWVGPEPERFAAIDTRLRQQFPALSHVSGQTLQSRLDASDPSLLILDIRRPDEYEAGHIEGAIRIPPRASARDVMRQLDGRATGADVVVYCSVGVRSSRLADRISNALDAAGAASLANLQGGIFAWHNEGRPVVTEAGGEARVHPYNKHWGKLLATPEPSNGPDHP